MPDQPDPNQNQPTNPPVINPAMDLPPLPTDTSSPNSPAASSPNQTDEPAASSSDTQLASAPASPPQSPSVIATKPKKKFGGGKIIATILGILLLIGGIGAGIYLTQQQQLFQQKAYTLPGDHTETCGLIQVAGVDNPSCPKLLNNTGQNDVSTYETIYTVTNISDQQHTVSIVKNSNYCTQPYGFPGNEIYCHENPVQEPLEITLEPGQSQEVPISRSSDSGTSCGSYQTDLLINAVDNNTDCHGSNLVYAGQGGLVSWGICQTGTTCTGATPTPTPAAASCVNVKAYDTSWNELNDSDLAALKVGDKVNFCVTGDASSGAFDKAQFKIGSTLLAETATKGQGVAANNYCQDYTIKDTDTTVTVLAAIHHVSLGWVGEAIAAQPPPANPIQ